MATIFVLLFLAATILGAAYALSRLIQAVFEDRPPAVVRWLSPLERGTYRAMRVDPTVEMRPREYTLAVLGFSTVSVLVLFGIQRVQGALPLNPSGLHGVSPHLAFNTAVSFVTNTNWQSYTPEQTMTYLTQMAGLVVQNFASAAVGLAVAIAVVRGIRRSESQTIGNFWSDVTRGIVYILLPLSFLVALVLVSRGVVQTFAGPLHVRTLEGASQTIARGPFASQEAIKELGTNGGGSYNANSAHPFENPTPFTNLLEIWSLLVIPFSMPFVYGRMVGRMSEGLALLATMLVLLGSAFAVSINAETHATPALRAAGISASAPNLEGKEQRFTVQEAAIFSDATTGTSTGAVDSMHDSYSAIGGAVPMVLLLLGEVAPGGVGTGLYGLLLFAVLTVFIGGLMVGRTPELLGKTITGREVKLAVIGVLVMPIGLLASLAIASVTAAGRSGPLNVGAHGFSEITYGFASAWNNNGSAFAGLTATNHFYLDGLGVSMLLGRFVPIAAVLALAGALARKSVRPVGPGTMPTGSPMFVGLLLGVIVLVGALSFFPALALGPIAEALSSHLS